MMKTAFLRRLAEPVAAFIFLTGNASAAVLWVQDFNDSNQLADYIGTGPNQADAISTSNAAGLNWSIFEGALRADRTGNAGAFTINGDDWDAETLQVEIRMNIADITSTFGSGLMFAAGTGLPTGNSHPANALTHSDFGINFANGAVDTYRFRDHDNTTNLGVSPWDAIETGQWIDVWWGINNSGNDLNYFRPDGTIATLMNHRWDLWVNVAGAWHQLADNPVNTVNGGTVLDDFKITYQNAGGTVLFDSIRISDRIVIVPELSTGLSFVLGGLFLSFRRRRIRLSLS